MRLPARRLRTGAHLVLGLGVVGAAGYAFVAIVGHVFVVPEYAAEVSALTSLYLLVNIIGPGLFAALEPETSRVVSASVAAGQPVRPVVSRVALLAARILAALVVALVLAWPLFLSRVLAGRVELLATLLLAAVGAAAVYWVRGVLSGQRRFRGYAATLYLEGLVRLLPCIVLLVLAVRSPVAYGFVFALGAGVAALALMPTLRVGQGKGPNALVAGTRRSLSLLISATLLTQVVANLAPVIVTYRSSEDLAAASAFAVSFVLARVPLMLFAPMQAVLLPQLAAAATAGKLDIVRRRMRQVLLVVAALGGLMAVLGALFGPAAVRLLFNVTDPPAGWVFGLLGLATLLIMAALAMQPALIALGLQRSVTLGWVAGTAVFLLLLIAPVPPITAALIAQVAGPAIVLAVSGLALRHVLETGRDVGPGSDPLDAPTPTAERR